MRGSRVAGVEPLDDEGDEEQDGEDVREVDRAGDSQCTFSNVTQKSVARKRQVA